MTNQYTARFWNPGDGKDIICQLCPRCCRLKEGQHGFCLVRQNIDGKLVLTTYGRCSGFCIDPIEKKPLYHFYPGTGILSFGTIGCNLNCRFCQNWQLSRAKEIEARCVEAPPDVVVQAAEKFACTSIAFTYNEPLIFAEYAIDVARACRKKRIRTVAVTAGYVQEKARSEFFEHMDAANVDLKSFREDFYKRLTGATLAPVLDTLRYIRKSTKTWLEITTLLVPGENDSDEELNELTQWIHGELGPETPLHFSAFHPDYEMAHHPPTPYATLNRARQIGLSKGLRYVYTGNVHDLEGSTTYCHGCHQALIKRNGFHITQYNLKERERCANCGTSCAGHFDILPGNWGDRRQPVAMEP